MRRQNAQPRIPIVFEEQKNSTKTKLAKLLKQYNACMTFNPDQNTYEVDVEVKFNSVGQKMQFMQNYLKKPREQSILEEQEHNNSKKYLTQLKQQKALINFSSIKKNTELQYSMSQEYNLIQTQSKQPEPADSIIQEENINYEQLQTKLQQVIDRTCEDILLMKIRSNIRPQQNKTQTNTRVVNKQSNFSSPPSKTPLRQVGQFKLPFPGKSKEQIMFQINKDLVVSNQQYSQQQMGGFVMQQNMLFQDSDEQDSSYKIGANKWSQTSSNPYSSIIRNNQSSKIISRTKTISQNLSKKSQIYIKQQQKDQISIINTPQNTKVSYNKTNNSITKQQYHRMMAQKQKQLAKQSKSKLNFAKPSKISKPHVTFSQKSSSKPTSLVQNHNKYGTTTKTDRSNKVQHQSFKKFLMSHRQKLDEIIQSYNKDQGQILIEDQLVFDSVNTSKDFSNQILEQYKQKIEVNNANMSSTQMIGYFKFLIRHAKNLYLDFQREKR